MRRLSRIPRWMHTLALLMVGILTLHADPPPVNHSQVGERMLSADGSITLTCIGKKQNYDLHDSLSRDSDVVSPKSVNFHPDGSRYYVNSLEGCRTIVYDVTSGRKLAVINHRFDSGNGPMWNTASPYYSFKHYLGGDTMAFSGKPVESAFSHGGRYLWVPYYRRTFDLNAQDPSAVAIIDTQADTICRMMETGPLPKMVTASHDGTLMAITHWGDNTVGIIDVSDPDPHNWHHLAPIVVQQQLTLDFSLDEQINRDEDSGLRLRGTAFTPDDRWLLVGCMGGEGIAVIDMVSRKYVGMITGVYNVRHLIIGGGYLYASFNTAGQVKRVPLDSVITSIRRGHEGRFRVNGWQSCQVGKGARTIELSPSGNFLFVACNDVSSLYVVNTRTMTVAGCITVDSYPVGLHLSQDGNLLVTTSQGREGQGGNAINLFKVEYAQPEIISTTQSNQSPWFDFDKKWYPLLGGTLVMIVLLLTSWFIKRRSH